jgi:hypothetical protein
MSSEGITVVALAREQPPRGQKLVVRLGDLVRPPLAKFLPVLAELRKEVRVVLDRARRAVQPIELVRVARRLGRDAPRR